MKIYKVRDGQGRWSSGGSSPQFTEKGGKTWRSIGHVKCHLKLYQDVYGYGKRRPLPEDWEIVEFIVSTPEQARIFKAREFVVPRRGASCAA